MLEFQEKKKIREFMYSRPTLVVIAIVLAISVNATYRMYQKASETGTNRSAALREEEILKDKANNLESQIGQLKTSRGTEEEIRKKYRVVKEGESIIIVVDDSEVVIDTVEAQPGFQSLYDRIKSLFK